MSIVFHSRVGSNIRWVTHSACGGCKIDHPFPLLISSGHTSMRNQTTWPTMHPTMSAPNDLKLPDNRPEMRIMAIGSCTMA